jgi:tetratricopeptide (TPR) repeat protein
MSMERTDYSRTCFVIMPFGKKEIVDGQGRRRSVDFDRIYQEIFEPAIRGATLPEGGSLMPRRTDQDFFGGDITQQMFEYLNYSRVAIVDITGLNPNVIYQLGVRHRANPAGTVIFRQVGAKIPFDISQVKAFPYEFEPSEEALKSEALITQVLTESLQRNRIDSTGQRALTAQRSSKSFIEPDLKDAENALRIGDRAKAIAAYRRGSAGDPDNNLLHLRLGLLLKDDGKWSDALEQFDKAITAAPGYAEAWREKGIAENKLYHKAGKPAGMATGIEALRRSIELSPDDYDAHAPLGSALRREGRLREALAEYEQATDISGGHPYPLLSSLSLRKQLDGRLVIDNRTRSLMQRAESTLRAQVSSEPPDDPPWSFFNLAELRLYDGDVAEAKKLAALGVEHASADWQVTSFADSLDTLVGDATDLPGLRDLIKDLREQASVLVAAGAAATPAAAAMLSASIQIDLVSGDAVGYEADVLALKYAQFLYGLDRKVVGLLAAKGASISNQLPETGRTLLLSSNGTTAAKELLFVGVEPQGRFDYQAIRRFSKAVLSTLARERPSVRSVAMTLHGRGFGLDEEEAFRAEIAGVLDAISAGAFPTQLQRVAIVESVTSVTDRLAGILRTVLPTGSIGAAPTREAALMSLSHAQAQLGDVGHDSSSKPNVFVAMPFAEKYDDRYHYGVSGAVNSAGFICERADMAQFTGDVLEWVKKRIQSASLVVADLSDGNPNVYLEVGFAWGSGVPTVLIVPENEKVPFDVAQQRRLIFRSIKHLEELLTKELQGLLRQPGRSS